MREYRTTKGIGTDGEIIEVCISREEPCRYGCKYIASYYIWAEGQLVEWDMVEYDRPHEVVAQYREWIESLIG